jgi:hypothetical protein
MLYICKSSAPNYTVDNSYSFIDTDGVSHSFNIPANSVTNLPDLISGIKTSTSAELLLSDTELLYVANDDILDKNNGVIQFPLTNIQVNTTINVGNVSLQERYAWGIGGLALGLIIN